jgi:hypothetical protein
MVKDYFLDHEFGQRPNYPLDGPMVVFFKVRYNFPDITEGVSFNFPPLGIRESALFYTNRVMTTLTPEGGEVPTRFYNLLGVKSEQILAVKFQS